MLDLTASGGPAASRIDDYCFQLSRSIGLLPDCSTAVAWATALLSNS